MEVVINEFSDKIQRYIDSYDDEFYERSLRNLEKHVDFKRFDKLYRFSSSFTDFMRKVNFKSKSSLNLLDNVSRLYSSNQYLIKLRKPCFESILKFKKLLESKNIINSMFIKELVISFTILVLYMPFGEITNLDLFELRHV